MVDCMRIAALLLIASVAAAHAAPADDIPLLAEVKGARAHVVVRGELGKAKQREVVALVSQVVADVERRFTGKRATDPQVTLLLFTDRARYREVATTLSEPLISELGFYLPGQRVAIANVGNSVGNVRHELVHPLLGDDFTAIPAWLNEGIAALYGSAKHTKRGFSFLVNYRLRDLQRALKAGTLPTLHQLATSTSNDVRGDQAMVYYALARYVLLYVDRIGKLSQLYAELRAATADHHSKILASYVDETAFRAWARKLHL